MRSKIAKKNVQRATRAPNKHIGAILVIFVFLNYFSGTFNNTTHPKSIQCGSVGCQKYPKRVF